MRIKCSIVCFNNSLPEIEKLLVSLNTSAPEVMVTVIDNSPRPHLRDVVEMHGASYRHFPENIGFGAGHNKAMVESLLDDSLYHLVLNPDIELNHLTVSTLVEFMDRHPEVGAVAPKVFYPDGQLQYLCKLLPTPMDLFFRRFMPGFYKKTGMLGRYELHDIGYKNLMAVPFLSGCCVLFRCCVLKKVGLFDERYFMYMEDVDLSRRIGRVSETMFFPDATVIHQYAKGSYRNCKLLSFHVRSAILYFNKWGWIFDSERKNRNLSTIAALNETRKRGATGFSN